MLKPKYIQNPNSKDGSWKWNDPTRPKVKWNFGKYEWKWKQVRPTLEIFNKWKKDFLALPEVEDYEVWVSGGFLESLNNKNRLTKDIDITFFGPLDYEKIEKILYEGMNIGITKYSVLVDMHYQIGNKDHNGFGKTKPNWKFHKQKQKTNHICMCANQLIKHKDTKYERISWWKKDAIQITEGLYYMTYKSPSDKHVSQPYYIKPKCIKI